MLVKIYEKHSEKIDPKEDEIIEEYVEDRGIDNIVGCSGKNVFEDFIEFCSDHKIKTKLKNIPFRKRLYSLFQLKSYVIKYDGACVRVIIRKGDV